LKKIIANALAYFLLLFFIATPAWAATDRFIDADCTNGISTYDPDGSGSADGIGSCTGGENEVYDTLQHAHNDADNGDTFYVMGTVYMASDASTHLLILTLDNTTWTSYDSNPAVVDGINRLPGLGTAARHLIFINGGTGNTIDGLTVQNSPSAGIIIAYSATDNTVKNCEISWSFTSNVSVATFSHDVVIEDNVIYNGARVVQVHSANCSALDGTAYHCGGQTNVQDPPQVIIHTSDNPIFRRNTVYNSFGEGAILFGRGTINGLCEYNTFYGNQKFQTLNVATTGTTHRYNLYYGVYDNGNVIEDKCTANETPWPCCDGEDSGTCSITTPSWYAKALGYQGVRGSLETQWLDDTLNGWTIAPDPDNILDLYLRVYGNYFSNSDTGIKLAAQAGSIKNVYIFHNTIIDPWNDEGVAYGIDMYDSEVGGDVVLLNNIVSVDSNGSPGTAMAGKVYANANLWSENPSSNLDANDYCGNIEYTNQSACETAGHVWVSGSDPEYASPTVSGSDFSGSDIDGGDLSKSDYALLSGSAGIDGAVAITYIDDTDATADSFSVDNPEMFYGDEEITIVTAGGNVQRTITKVERNSACTGAGDPWACCTDEIEGSCNTVEVDSDITFEDENPIYLRFFVGSAPDIGAYEYSGASASGTIVVANGISESEVVAGGKTIVIDLTNAEWVAAGATFNAQRANIIAGLDSDKAEATGWNAVLRDAGIDVDDVIRTDADTVTITLDAEPTYNITASETVTVTIPASATDYDEDIVGSPTFSIIVDASESGLTYNTNATSIGYNANAPSISVP